MNWEAVGAIGEIAGAGAVVVSLAYLAIQVRHNTRAMRRSSSSDAVASFRDFLGQIAHDPDTARIFRKGLESLDSLNEEDLARCWVLLYIMFKTFDDLHYQHRLGLMDPEVWKSYEFFAKGYLTGPGARQYWRERRSAFTRPFQEWVDSITPNADFKRLGPLIEEPSGEDGGGS